MKRIPSRARSIVLLLVIVILLVLFAYAALRSGPLAPVPVTLDAAEAQSIAPALFGVGTVETRYAFRIGPTATGRLSRLDAHVGDQVKAGQVLGEMDPVDLDARVRSQEASIKRAEAAAHEAEARHVFAGIQAHRYEQLFAEHSTSEEILATKREELQVAEAAFRAARDDLARAHSDRDGLLAQRNNLRLIAPVNGIVTARDFDPGSTILAGQTVVEVVDPKSVWISVRFDQASSAGLVTGLPAQIVLRSHGDQVLKGHVFRVEPKADAITEETLAKVSFDTLPISLPPLGELAEVTVGLPPIKAAAVIPNAAVHRVGNRVGVWQFDNGSIRYVPIKIGATDLDGRVQVRDGLGTGDRVVVYSAKAVDSLSRIQIVEHVPAGTK